MNNPLVSVIIPNFNRADVIMRAVGSALRQTHSELEVIVVDDASSNAAEMAASLKSIEDSRVQMIRHEVNQGGAAARNTGVAAARGDCIAFLDSDDEWLPEKIEKQLQNASQQTDDKWLIYSQSGVLTTQGSEVRRGVMPMLGIRPDEAIGDYLFAGRGWLQTSSMLLPTKLARECLFNPALRRHQDYDFLLRLEAQGCRFLMVPEPLVVVHWEDLHQSARGLDPESSLRFLDEYEKFLSPKARSGFVYSQIVSRLLGAGRRGKALGYAARHIKPWHLSLVQHVSLISGLIFGDARISRYLARIKRGLTPGRTSRPYPHSS